MRLRIDVLEADVTRDRMVALRDVLRAHSGECEVMLRLTIPGESTTLLSLGEARGVQPSEGLCREVDALFGRPVAEACI